MRTLVASLCLICFLTGCSTFNYREKTLAYMGGGFIGGGIIGASQADDRENKEMHGLLWGSLIAAGIAVVMTYFKDENKEIKNKDLRIAGLQRDLEAAKAGQKVKIEEGNTSFYEKGLPGQFQHLVQPGEWKLYEVDEWKKVSDGVLIHQDRMIEYKEPKLKVTK